MQLEKEKHIFPNILNIINRLKSCRPATAQVERVHSLLTLTTGKNRTCLLIGRLYKLVFLKLRWSNGTNALKWSSNTVLVPVEVEGACLFELYTADDPDNIVGGLPDVMGPLKFN